jgi:DNA polymerase III subunit delta'
MADGRESWEAPWLAAAVRQLHASRAAGRFPSALLIHERRGAGAEALALLAAALALCREPSAPCGQCRDCRALAADQHPDFLRIAPAADARLIRVEQIRELCEQLALTAHGGGASVALIAPADAMNANAANALLKTLEEPRAGVTLILLTNMPSALPATIVSRCQQLRIPAPSRAQAIAWLEQRRGTGPWDAVLDVLGNAPFEALEAPADEIAQLHAETLEALAHLKGGTLDVTRIAEGWGRAASFEWRLGCLENWLTSRIEEGMLAAREAPELRSGAHSPPAASDLNMAKSLRVLDGLYELRRLRLSAINRPLALEWLLRELAAAQRRGSARSVHRGSVRGHE